MMLPLEQFLAVVIPTVAGLAWLFRLEGRINGHDTQHKQHQERHDQMREDLAYIRQRIDHVLSGWKQ
jgi:hypothetical protein